MAQNYTAQSPATGYYITSTMCDVPGQIVATADGKGGIPAGATLTFSKALQPATTEVTIKGLSGLYITLPPASLSNPSTGAVSGSKLVWSSTPAIWQVDVTKTGPYVIVPDGMDLYWFTDNSIGPIVQVKSGAQIKGTENEWIIYTAK
ncbi:hypothetical protein IW261DRAFT_1562028 [Armillaria novae-zelandiae]|uniref:Uncharacterized protein n=1 Tax=Armillaria novae-zelandiae TaxID=153914 RepID=A0AA39PEI6_9AGAR|nr:hypothetical protein IW261DRAFT_1562028 [Armillaria novae-zelandiae]